MPLRFLGVVVRPVSSRFSCRRFGYWTKTVCSKNLPAAWCIDRSWGGGLGPDVARADEGCEQCSCGQIDAYLGSYFRLGLWDLHY